MNYYYEEGKIGEYKGYEVVTIDYKDFKQEMCTHKNIIYAVKNVDDILGQKMVLVYQGNRIGVLSPNGTVHTNERIFPFTFKEKRRIEKSVVTKPEVTTTTSKEVEDYGDYSRDIDMFFENLKKNDWFLEMLSKNEHIFIK